MPFPVVFGPRIKDKWVSQLTGRGWLKIPAFDASWRVITVCHPERTTNFLGFIGFNNLQLLQLVVLGHVKENTISWTNDAWVMSHENYTIETSSEWIQWYASYKLGSMYMQKEWLFRASVASRPPPRHHTAGESQPRHPHRRSELHPMSPSGGKRKEGRGRDYWQRYQLGFCLCRHPERDLSEQG
jgi:hypothetical protein